MAWGFARIARVDAEPALESHQLNQKDRAGAVAEEAVHNAYEGNLEVRFVNPHTAFWNTLAAFLF
jgi:hypothetical protein